MGNAVSFKKEFGLIIVGAIIFTASFLWKDLLTDIEELYFPKKYGLTGRVIFTALITMILVLAAVQLRSRFGLTNQQSRVRFDDDPLNNPGPGNDSVGFGGGDDIGFGNGGEA